MRRALIVGAVGAVLTFGALTFADHKIANEFPDFEIEYERNALASLAIGAAIFAYAVGYNRSDET